MNAPVSTTLDGPGWLAEMFSGLTDEMPDVSPSEWAETKRYLPPEVSPVPGRYSFEVAPYLREIVDCLDRRSPVRYIDVMKGAQVGATVGILENGIGYCAEHEKNQPMILATADSDMAAQRLEQYVLKMFHASGLMKIVRSADVGNKRKAGRTSRKIEWVGGGILMAFGAKSPSKMRSFSVSRLLEDEVDGWPDKVGKDGDPMALLEARTNSFALSRKVVALSTPLMAGSSKIQKRFLMGDQRRYFVPCRKCGTMQFFRWHGVNEETGLIYGMRWDDDEDGNLVSGSVRYVCRECGYEHINDDKAWMLPRGEWKATAKPVDPTRRSYHIPAMLSPVGFFSWEHCVYAWKEAWDTKHNRVRDAEKLQVFYNNILGEPFEPAGQKLTFQRASSHRLRDYRLGTVPNKHALAFGGGRIEFLLCTVDVHGSSLIVSVVGWTKSCVAYQVYYDRWHGDAECTGNLDDAATWGRLRKFIEEQRFQTDDGEEHRIFATLIDSGHNTDTVVRFCSEYAGGVMPVKGYASSQNVVKTFRLSPLPSGTSLVQLNVDYYKDRMASSLRREWDQQTPQSTWHWNAPADLSDAAIKELTVETKREKIDKVTGKSMGYQWHRPNGVPNELWDLSVYQCAAVDMIALECSPEDSDGNRVISWQSFMRACEAGAFATKKAA